MVSVNPNSKSIASQSEMHDEETYKLISTLRSLGIDYLISGGSYSRAAGPIPPAELIIRLARCEYPRLRNATIALLLLHPEFAEAAYEAYNTCEPALAEQIAVLILATLYLQRQWYLRLTMALGRTPAFPEQPFAYLWQARMLPEPACQQGEIGLLVLQDVEQRRRGWPLDLVGDWQYQVECLLLQEEARRRLSPVSFELLEAQGASQNCIQYGMNKAVIDEFLAGLGQLYRAPAQLYLARDAALVHVGARTSNALQIDLVLDMTDWQELVKAIRHVEEKMRIFVSIMSPNEFMPLPARWATQAKAIGRFGSLTANYFDFYGLSLKKIARGSNQDLLDVKGLLQQHVITLEELDLVYREMLPRNANPERFTERYTLIRQQLQKVS